MLANIYENGKKKVEKYWPDINEDRDFDGIRVQYVSTEVFANYEFRVFNVCKKNVQRKIEQLHFTSWPDHGVPLYSQSLVPFLQKILKIPNKSNSPVVVHCRMAAGEGSIDFLANLENIRSQRANMVDNVDQYKLAHLVVLECLFGMHTSIPCNEHMDKDIEALLQSNVIKAQLKYLADTEWQDKAMDTTWDVEEVPINTDKDRFVDIVPEQQHQIYLARYPLQDGRSSYINAIQVDGFRNPGRYIVTQQPMPNTLGDFWRLVAERKSTLIISLNEINQDDEQLCPGTDMNFKPDVKDEYILVAWGKWKTKP
ncbi:hypothetical protein NQ314_005702 [Rhamnusium bicolor]|uniref:protein-tyrosine-phosphatase n=1 Tax=Rhamnusium bicolor TaxID=1586634 RepID=A0AAV8ZEB3_9CUCU|nr:hypothetical protein NQ314_005702 [Rhamnusium bicolor]